MTEIGLLQSIAAYSVAQALFLVTSLGYKIVATWLAEYFLQVKKINGRIKFPATKMQQCLVASVTGWSQLLRILLSQSMDFAFLSIFCNRNVCFE